MDKVFLQVLNMSITSSYVILSVLAARLLLKKAPKIFSHVLWFVVLFRLICPISFESMFSLIPINTQTVAPDIMYSQTLQISSGISLLDQVATNSLPAPAAYNSANPMQIWIAIGEGVWLLGVTVLLVYSIFTTIKLHRKLKNAKHVSENIYEMKGLETPFVFGVIKPKIFLPVGLSDSEMSYILKHEQTHIKRLDHIVKPLAFIVLSIHWFNPLVWLAFYLMSQDMELSCDESVIKKMGSGIKKDYSTSLLRVSTGRRTLGCSPLAFGENNTKGRIMNILNYKKPATWVVTLAAAAVIIIGIGLLTNPNAASNDNDTASDLEKLQMVEIWAEALKTRDGKPRYEIMSESMKEQFVAEQINRSGEEWNYNIGVSSPWVVDYEIDLQGDTGRILYHLTDSTGGKYEQTEILTFGQENDRLVVIDAKEKFGTEILAGYIVIEGDNLYFDEVEIVKAEDKERVSDLGLRDSDMPNGYIIINEKKEEASFELADDVKYTFTDLDLHFVKEAEGSRLYSTTKKAEFLKHLGVLNDIPLSEQTIPYFIEVQDGKVISITEEFQYTI
jgi:bla regulator protein BlaR1